MKSDDSPKYVELSVKKGDDGTDIVKQLRQLGHIKEDTAKKHTVEFTNRGLNHVEKGQFMEAI